MSMGKGGQPRVLLVEDEPAQRTVLAYNLEAEGFAVTQADNGEDAMMLVDEEEPDIIILDLNMPGMDGLTAIPLFQQESPQSRILILTMHDDVNASALYLGVLRNYRQDGQREPSKTHKPFHYV